MNYSNMSKTEHQSHSETKEASSSLLLKDKQLFNLKFKAHCPSEETQPKSDRKAN